MKTQTVSVDAFSQTGSFKLDRGWLNLRAQRPLAATRRMRLVQETGQTAGAGGAAHLKGSSFRLFLNVCACVCFAYHVVTRRKRFCKRQKSFLSFCI